MYRYLHDASYVLSPDESLSSNYESDDESYISFSDFEKLAAHSTSDNTGATPGQISSTSVEGSETKVDPNKVCVKLRKKKRNLGILSHIKRVQKMAFHRQPMLESSSQCKFLIIKREESIKKSPVHPKSLMSKDISPSRSLIESKKFGKYHDPNDSSSEESSPLSVKEKQKKYPKRTSVSKPSPSKYVSISSPKYLTSSSEDDSAKKNTAKMSSQHEISASKCASTSLALEESKKRPSESKPSPSKYLSLSSPKSLTCSSEDDQEKKNTPEMSSQHISASKLASLSTASKERKKKYRKRLFEPKPATSKHLSSLSSSSSSSFTEEYFEHHSNLPERERLRKLCKEFLQFQRLRFSNLKVAENKLILNMHTLNSIIKKSMKLCMKIIDVRHVPPGSKENLEYENNRLLYIIGKSSLIFEELNRYVNEMTQEINQFIKESDTALAGSDLLLENLMFTLLFFNAMENTS